MAESPTVLINAIGVGAALCSMASFVPQVMKLLRERDASGISVRMYVVAAVGFVLWCAYGALTGAWPLTLSNAVNLLLVLTILFLKVRFRGR